MPNFSWSWITKKEHLLLTVNGEFEKAGRGSIRLTNRDNRWDLSFYAVNYSHFIKKFELNPGSLQDKMLEAEMLATALDFTPDLTSDTDPLIRISEDIPFGWAERRAAGGPAASASVSDA